jgi:hypothetical protein
MAGCWDDYEPVATNVETPAPDGQLTGSDSSQACTISGNVAPRPSGKNVFDVTLSFGAVCGNWSNLAGTGVALAYPVGAQTQLLIAVTDNANQQGRVIHGQGPGAP